MKVRFKFKEEAIEVKKVYIEINDIQYTISEDIIYKALEINKTCDNDKAINVIPQYSNQILIK